MLDALPPEVLLRIIASPDGAPRDPSVLRSAAPLRVAQALSHVSARLRALVRAVYLGETLRHVDFTRVSCDPFLTAATLRALASAPRLASFAAAYPRLRGDAAVAPLLAHAALASLSLRGMSGVTDRFLTGARLPALARLDLSYVSAVAAAALAAASALPALRTLTLAGCASVDDAALSALLRPGGCAGRTLARLNVAYCPLSDAALAACLRRAPALAALVLAPAGCNLWATGAYSAAGVADLQARYPGVVRFEV